MTLVTMENLKGSMCKWPIGDPRDDDFHFCGCKRESEAPYCQKHTELAYRRSEVRGGTRTVSNSNKKIDLISEQEIEDASPAVKEEKVRPIAKTSKEKEKEKKETAAKPQKKAPVKTEKAKKAAPKKTAKKAAKKPAKKKAVKKATSKKKTVKKTAKKAVKKTAKKRK